MKSLQPLPIPSFKRNKHLKPIEESLQGLWNFFWANKWPNNEKCQTCIEFNQALNPDPPWVWEIVTGTCNFWPNFVILSTFSCALRLGVSCKQGHHLNSPYVCESYGYHMIQQTEFLRPCITLPESYNSRSQKFFNRCEHREREKKTNKHYSLSLVTI